MHHKIILKFSVSIYEIHNVWKLWTDLTSFISNSYYFQARTKTQSTDPNSHEIKIFSYTPSWFLYHTANYSFTTYDLRLLYFDSHLIKNDYVVVKHDITSDARLIHFDLLSNLMTHWYTEFLIYWLFDSLPSFFAIRFCNLLTFYWLNELLLINDITDCL